jgi:rsbT co-antagonist protein RsbR
MEKRLSHLHVILQKYGREILTDWTAALTSSLKNDRRMSESEIANQTREFLTLLENASAAGGSIEGAGWAPIRDFLDGISRSRAQQGFTSDETATFIFSFKKPLFQSLREEFGTKPEELAERPGKLTICWTSSASTPSKSFRGHGKQS